MLLNDRVIFKSRLLLKVALGEIFSCSCKPEKVLQEPQIIFLPQHHFL